MTHEFGGNLLRVLFRFSALLAEIAPYPQRPASDFLSKPHEHRWHLLPVSRKVAALDLVSANLRRILDTLENLPPNGEGLAFSAIDDYVSGVCAFNASHPESRRIQVLLTLVALPPIQILEAPSKTQLEYFSRDYTFQTLWDLYVEISERLWRMVVQRYVVDRGPDRIVFAFEISNEPDCEWLPDELRTVKQADSDFCPLGKYITASHYSQIPESQIVSPPVEQTEWGSIREQAGPWSDEWPMPIVPIVDFDWGHKFDWYVRNYSDFAERTSLAIMDETRKAGCDEVEIVSGGVWHSNVDYLMRMYRANPRAFAHCTAIGLHPSCLPEKNIYAPNGGPPSDISDWRSASPREFAANYLTRFEFFSEIAKLTRCSGSKSFGLEGKKLWFTEMKIPPSAEFQEEPLRPILDPYAFDKLVGANCEAAILFFTPRGNSSPGQLAPVRDDGSREVDDEILSFIRAFQNAGQVMKFLRVRPWESVSSPREALDTLSMLTEDEKRLLFWCTSQFYEDKGEIVELGAFVGGSSVALAAGLRKSRHQSDRTVKVFDRFITDEFINSVYLKPNGLAAVSRSFRHIYSQQTSAFADLLTVYEGDVTKAEWNGAPIEILFIDISKAWQVNDHVNRTFFPYLIPGKSLVIQQDFFHQWEYWTILTMELLKDYFEYAGFVPWNSAVYLCTRPIPLRVIPEDLRSLGLNRLRALLDSQIARHEEPYLRGILKTALVGLLRDFGSLDEAQEVERTVTAEFPGQPAVLEAVRQFGLNRSAADLRGR